MRQSSRHIPRIAQACAAIANETADESGFVSIRSLLRRFDARLEIRPLLTEALVAEAPSFGGGSPSRWTVFVDSDKFRVHPDDIDEESSSRPLPSRLRTTIAHELLHLLSFRPGEFGFELQTYQQEGKARAGFVKEIERDTERLTPMLLWSEKSIRSLVARDAETLSMEELQRAQRMAGLSRQMLISRLCLLQTRGPKELLFEGPLRNLVVGMAQWTSDNRAVTHNWPLFSNFDRNLIPTFVAEIRRQDRAPAEELFPDPEFLMAGGPSLSTKLIFGIGTALHPRAETLKMEIAVEASSRREGNAFLFLARAVQQELQVDTGRV